MNDVIIICIIVLTDATYKSQSFKLIANHSIDFLIFNTSTALRAIPIIKDNTGFAREFITGSTSNWFPTHH